MLKTSLKKIGRIGKANIKCNRILAKRWQDKGIDYCELRLPGCLGTWLLQNVHRNKRYFYKGIVEELTKNSEVKRGCQNCHNLVENNKELREEVFKRLRK